MLKLAACASISVPAGDGPVDWRPALREAIGVAPRRVNRFIELALLGAAACRAQAGGLPADTALYLWSDTGMLADTARIIEGLAQDQPPTPFAFMNVSGAMAGFYVAQQFGLQGPNLTVHRRHSALEAALELIALPSAPHRHAVVGFVEEMCWPLAAQRQRLDAPVEALSESSHWLYFDADATAPQLVIESCERHDSLAGIARSLGGIDRSRLALCAVAGSRNAAPVDEWARALSIDRMFGVAREAEFSAGLPARALCEFAGRGEPGALLIVNRATGDEWHATRVRVPDRQ